MFLEIFLYKRANPNWPSTRHENFAIWERFTDKDGLSAKDQFLASPIWGEVSDMERAVYVGTSDYCTLCSQCSPSRFVADENMVGHGDCKDCVVVDQSPNYLGDEYFENQIIIGKKNRRTVVFVWQRIADGSQGSSLDLVTKSAEILEQVPDTCFDLEEESEEEPLNCTRVNPDFADSGENYEIDLRAVHEKIVLDEIQVRRANEYRDFLERTKKLCSFGRRK